MDKILGYSCDKLKQEGGYITAVEINNQPRLWKETFEIIEERKEEVNAFLKKVFAYADVRVVFTGAGSSAFVGDSVVPCLRKKLGYKVEAIPTTDIVSNPSNYLYKNVPTLLISCARSGNSPESIAAVNLAETLVDNLYQIVLTCNAEGQLAQHAVKNDNILTLFMPKDSNDQGFAMTGSFTTMVLSSLAIFSLDELDDMKTHVSKIADNGNRILLNNTERLRKISNLDFERTVYLGSASLLGAAKESALKLLELTAGKVATSYDTCLGFRHGPKSIIDDKTLIVIYFSNDLYARKYEMDLLREVHLQKGKKKILAVTEYKDDEIEKMCDFYIYINECKNEYIDDSYLLFNYILNAQILALHKSIMLGITPDNPSPDGSVNRVVEGVIIYSYLDEKFS